MNEPASFRKVLVSWLGTIITPLSLQEIVQGPYGFVIAVRPKHHESKSRPLFGLVSSEILPVPFTTLDQIITRIAPVSN